jgi:SAM-dependent methyltransferase
MNRSKETRSEGARRLAEGFYDELAEGYELMINWDARLEREAPFFRKLFGERGVASVLDCACGSGRHAVEFASWGIEAAGCDISGEMLRLAKRNASQAGAVVDLFKAGMTEVSEKAGGRKFDAVVCLGNSLPHLPTQRELDRAMRSIRRALAPGGVFISQIRNYQKILRDNLRFMPPTSAAQGGRELVFLRMLDIHGPRRVDFHIIRLARESGKWSYHVHTTPLRPIVKKNMNDALRRAGFKKIHHYADYAFTPFAIDRTLDLITVAM